MSSHLRTLQKRILRRLGYTRQRHKWVIINDIPQMVPVKNGNIIAPSGADTGSPSYPKYLPRPEA